MIRRTEDGILTYSLRLPSRGDVEFLRTPDLWKSRALFSLAEAMYEFELWSKESPEYRIRIVADHPLMDSGLAPSVQKTLERLISYVLLLDVEVHLVPSDRDHDSESLDTTTPTENEKDVICLFSGGVDSLSGILTVYQETSRVLGTFCAHANQSRIVSIVRKVAAHSLAPRGINLVEIPAPQMQPRGYSQLRGFFYILSSAAVAVARKARRIVVSECGPTMYQPRFSPIDQVTMTTHPFVVDRARDIIQALCWGGVTVETPFENLTKAEVMSICPDKEAIAGTHSCISQRLEMQDGTCFGCVVRRLAALATGVPDTVYARDPITKENANAGNLLALLEFSANVLLLQDDMPWYQKELIETYSKWDLFRRFALDNFAALHTLELKGVRLTDAVTRLYGRVAAGVGSSILEERLGTLEHLSRTERSK